MTGTDRAGSGGIRATTERGTGGVSGATLDLLVTGYLSALARALDRRGVAESRLRIGPAHAQHLCGALDLEPVRFPPASGISLLWDERSGCSALLHRGDATGPEAVAGRLIARRYLHPAVVPHPDAVAEFAADLAAGRDVGMTCPVDAFGSGHGREHSRLMALADLARHAVPEVRLWITDDPRRRLVALAQTATQQARAERRK